MWNGDGGRALHQQRYLKMQAGTMLPLVLCILICIVCCGALSELHSE